MRRRYVLLYCIILSVAYYIWVFPTLPLEGAWFPREIEFFLYLFDSPAQALIEISPLVILWTLVLFHKKLLSTSKYLLLLYLIPPLVALVMVWDDYYPHIACALQGHPADHTESVGGIDADKDGIRDDVQCLIKQHYASDPEAHLVALQYAKSLQAMLTGEILYTEEELLDTNYFEEWNAPRVQQFGEFVDCLVDLDDPFYTERLQGIDWIDFATANTSLRGREYGMQLAGSSGGEIDEQYCHRAWMDTVQLPN